MSVNYSAQFNPFAHVPSADLIALVYQDLQMLADGTWVPDEESIDATMEVLLELGSRLGIKPHTTPMDGNDYGRDSTA